MPQPDSQQHLAARLAILDHPDAQDCTVYRPDEQDPDAEELDLGDAKIVFTGVFQPPADWDAEQRSEFYGDSAPELFMTAALECEAKPLSAVYFTAEIGDYVATMPGLGEVVMFYVHDCLDGENGRTYVLQRDDESLD
ncbi:hypothetical protein [Pseudomonas benzenivorans]|uniref:Uncharacterized protein n=1 Tax=Pseudomonas benzenivorans TaxID=556533 RepID=A0ABY5H8G9_9PSED|nr:hypothetical protein [Pseudomonas benzenivorans]UTW08560.1 hypothetical protein KDW96_04325 [Pseudomonas benzenivorans]